MPAHAYFSDRQYAVSIINDVYNNNAHTHLDGRCCCYCVLCRVAEVKDLPMANGISILKNVFLLIHDLNRLKYVDQISKSTVQVRSVQPKE